MGASGVTLRACQLPTAALLASPLDVPLLAESTDTWFWPSAGWGFYDAADVVDPDQEDGGEVYHFDLSDEVGVQRHSDTKVYRSQWIMPSARSSPAQQFKAPA
jgi:hypothetical protein